MSSESTFCAKHQTVRLTVCSICFGWKISRAYQAGLLFDPITLSRLTTEAKPRAEPNRLGESFPSFVGITCLGCVVLPPSLEVTTFGYSASVLGSISGEVGFNLRMCPQNFSLATGECQHVFVDD